MQIKTQTTLTKRLSALALAAVLSVSACAELAAQTWWASPVGITLYQTARLTFANVGEPRGIVVDWRFIDADGVIVARSAIAGWKFPFYPMELPRCRPRIRT